LETSQPQRPSWIDKLPQKDDYMFFVGIKTGTDTLEDGQNAALRDAMAKISNYFSVKIESVFSDKSTEYEHNLKYQLSSKSGAVVKGAKTEDSYYEKNSRIDGSFSVVRYNVFVLVSIRKSQVEAEIKRQRKEKEEKLISAYGYYQDGLTNNKNGDLFGSRRMLKESLAILNELDERLVVQIGAISVISDDLKISTVNALGEVQKKIMRVKATVHVAGAEQLNQIFMSTFTAAMNKSNFSMTSDNNNYVIVGDISIRESSYQSGNYFYYAEGVLTVTRQNRDDVILTVPVKVKSNHQNRDVAAQYAVRDAGAEAGSDLAKKLAEKDSSL
jgi:hypothetical protein